MPNHTLTSLLALYAERTGREIYTGTAESTALYWILNRDYFDGQQPLNWNLLFKTTQDDLIWHMNEMGFQVSFNTHGDFWAVSFSNKTFPLDADWQCPSPHYPYALVAAALIVSIRLAIAYPAQSEEELQTLREQWSNDPCWDLEKTEGFERYLPELFNYRLTKERKWQAEYQQKLAEKATRMGIPDNLFLAQHLTRLEQRLEKIEQDYLRS